MQGGKQAYHLKLHDLKRLDGVLKAMVQRVQALHQQASRTAAEEQELKALIDDFALVGDHLAELLDLFPNIDAHRQGKIKEVNTASYPKWPHDCWSP